MAESKPVKPTTEQIQDAEEMWQGFYGHFEVRHRTFGHRPYWPGRRLRTLVSPSAKPVTIRIIKNRIF